MKVFRVLVTFFFSWFVASVTAGVFSPGFRVHGPADSDGAALWVVIVTTLVVFSAALLLTVNWIWTWRIWERADGQSTSNSSVTPGM